MKTILVLTDFSENALKAAEAAAMLGGKLKAKLLLFHTNFPIPIVPYYTDSVPINANNQWQEDHGHQLKQLADHIKIMYGQINMGQHQNMVHTLLREGDLWSNVKQILKQEHVEMIVMGKRSGSTIDHILFGSDTRSIIEHATCPILIVSSGCPITKLDRVVFATNFTGADRNAITYLLTLGHTFNYELDIVHVVLYGAPPLPENQDMHGFLKKLASTNYPNVHYQNIRGKDLAERLLRFCKQNGADLLALTHDQHTYLARMLKEGNVGKVIANQKLPLVIFPPKFTGKNQRKQKNS